MTSSIAEMCKRVHDKTSEFESILNTISVINTNLKESSEKMLTTLNELVGKTKCCSVCYTHEANFVMLPCGHATFCESCAQRGLNRGRCFVCRSRVQSVTKIFL